MRKWYSLPTQRILETGPWPKFPSYCFLTHFRPTPPAEISFLLFRNYRPPLFVEAPLSAHWPRLVSGAFVYQDTRLRSQPHRTGVTLPSRHTWHFSLRCRFAPNLTVLVLLCRRAIRCIFCCVVATSPSLHTLHFSLRHCCFALHRHRRAHH